MSIKTWPKQERPREKLLTKGAHYLTDAELIAIFLRTGSKKQHVLDLARNLLKQFGSLRAILDCDSHIFQGTHGIGEAKFVQLQAALELGKRYLAESLQKQTMIENSHMTKAYLSSQLRHKKQEVFAAIFLSSSHKMLAYEELFFGTIHSAHVHPREVVKRALHHNAAGVIVAHNHPSGHALPSDSDIAITKVLKNALRLMDILLIDHIIVGDGETNSLHEMGLIPRC